MTPNPFFKFAAIASACALLAACEPSDREVRSAVEKAHSEESSAMKAMLGKMAPPMPTLKSVKKIGCKADGDNAYKCDVEIMAALSGEEKKGVISTRFVKGSDGWTISK